MAERKAPLRAVSPGEKPPKRTPATIVEALDGSSRDVLASMRRALAKKLDDAEVSSNSIASAYKELRELDRLIRQIDQSESSATDEGGGRDSAFDASAI